ncbi:hypothetical protein ACTIVE_8935 [Actinomadura verrucosospora]|uniref:Uncharacterized protein n=1 Tax=Actinomadura verrucosospora TaxID=46165 RepID=A0A7D3VZE5_ACTVE|nr:hypothetical protein ACTIVE_8935 [Actinomadura verrucosospora]
MAHWIHRRVPVRWSVSVRCSGPVLARRRPRSSGPTIPSPRVEGVNPCSTGSGRLGRQGLQRGGRRSSPGEPDDRKRVPAVGSPQGSTAGPAAARAHRRAKPRWSRSARRGRAPRPPPRAGHCSRPARSLIVAARAPYVHQWMYQCAYLTPAGCDC